MAIGPNIEISNNTTTLGQNTGGTVIMGVEIPAVVQGNLQVTGNLTVAGSVIGTTESFPNLTTPGTLTVGSGSTGMNIGVPSLGGQGYSAIYSTFSAPTISNHLFIGGTYQNTTAINGLYSSQLQINGVSIVAAFVAGATINGNLVTSATIATGGYTVATLPAGTIGQRAYVTDSTVGTGSQGSVVVGGGTFVLPVFRNATTWIIG